MAAQGSAVVEYKIFNNTARFNTLDASLYINDNASIFFEKFSTAVYKEIEGMKTLERSTGKTILEPYTKIDHTKKEVLTYQALGGRTLLLTDSYIAPQWNITEETKDISGSNCIKATTTFRGRDWEAWFAPDIALPYGPWKLHGLPGLILEIRDSTNTYVMQVTAITYRYDAIFDKNFTELYDAENESVITYKEYVEMKEEQRANAQATARSKAQPGTTFMKDPGRQGMELKYEWEE